MKTSCGKILSIFLCTIMVLASSIPAMASTDERDLNIRESLENERPREETISDSVELEHGTMYLEENSEYRIAYIVYNAGYITYSVAYKDNSGIAHTGSYYPNDFVESDVANNTGYSNVLNDHVNTNNLVSLLLSLEPEESIDFSSRAQAKNNVLTPAAALQFARDHAPQWKTPVNSSQIGSYRPGNITVNVYESVRGTARRDTIVNYYRNDTLISIAAFAFGFNLTKLINCVTNIFDGTRDYIAQVNGTLTYHTIDNSRTKIATINGTTYYWSAWDREYGVYAGDKRTSVEVIYNHMFSDYNNNVTYFGQKALEAYGSY